MTDRIRAYYLGGVLCALPLFIFPGIGDGLRDAKMALVLLAAALFCAIHLFEKVGVAFAALFFYLVFNATLSGFFHSFQVLNLLLFSGALVFSFSAVKLNAVCLEKVLNLFVWGTLIGALYACVQMAGFEPIFYKIRPEVTGNSPVGFLGQPTIFGSLTACGIVAALFLKRYYSAAIMAIPVIATGSSFTALSILVGLFVFASHRLKKNLLPHLSTAIFVAFLVSYFLFPEALNGKGRLEIWGRIWDESWKFPIFGHGLGLYPGLANMNTSPFQSALSLRMNGAYLQAHNDWLQMFFECGLIGFGLAAANFIHFCIRLRDNFLTTEVAAFGAIFLMLSVNAIGNFPVRLASHGTLAMVAFLVVLTYNRGRYVN